MSRRNKRPAPRVVANDSTLVKRANLAAHAGQHFGGDRDLYKTFGYPTHVDAHAYRSMYERGDLAGRLVDAYPDATWREPPTIGGLTNFDTIAKRLKLWSVLQRLDRLCQLGHYGVLLLGLDGGEDPATPATLTNYRLMYLQPHGEETAKISRWNDNPKSSRFGKPEIYSITTGTNWEGTGGGQRILKVHHSRVIHIAEDALEHEAIGLPRLERVYNRLMDLEKLMGGSAEMYWLNTAMFLQFNAESGVAWEPAQAEAMQDQMEELQHRLRRMIRTQGVDAHNLAPGLQGSSPGEHVSVQLDMIAGASGIPKRILIGSEAGELASSQDENAWSGRVAERRQQFATPTVLEPFIMRGIEQGWISGALESIEWPESDTLGERGRADVAAVTAQAVATYANTMGDPAISEDEFRAVLGLDPKPEMPVDEQLDESDEDVQQAFADRQRRATPRPEPDDDAAPTV